MWKFVDDKQFPVVHFHFPAIPTDDDITLWMEDWKALLEKGLPFVFVSDTRPLKTPLSPKQRKIIADFYAANVAEIHRLVRGGASIMQSSILRGAARAIAWLTPPPYPRREFTDYDEGRRWAEEQLDNAP